MGLFKKRRKKGIVGTVATAYKKAVREAEKQAKADARLAAKGPRRSVGDQVSVGAAFPLGVFGLLPVTTTYAGGKEVVCYAFTSQTVHAIVECAEELNSLMDAASELSGHEFGSIETVQCTITPQGWGFCRVEYSPFTKTGSENKTPVKLYVETSEVTCDPGSYSGWVKYDEDGLAKQVEVTEWVSPSTAYKMKASRVKGKVVIKLVTQCGIEEPLYKA